MTVDLKKAKVGDVVHFRCGGSAEISEVIEIANRLTNLEFMEFGLNVTFYNSGLYFRENPHLLDIIRIESK